MIGIDVDAYEGKAGGRTLAQLEQECGPLPETWRSSARPEDPVSGIRFYRVPEGWEAVGGLPGIEIIQRHHRFAVVPPSIHPSGQPYRWYPPGEASSDLPAPGDLPAMPEAWLERLRAAGSGSNTEKTDLATDEQRELLAAWCSGDEPCQLVAQAWQDALAACDSESRHDNVRNRVLALVRLGEEGHPGVRVALLDVREAFCEAVAGDRRGGREEAESEFNRFLAGAVRMIVSDPTPQDRQGCHCAEIEDVDEDEDEGRDGVSDSHVARTVTADVLAGAWCWSRGLGWLQWDGRRWERAPDEAVHTVVSRYLLARYREAVASMEQAAVQAERLKAAVAEAQATAKDAVSGLREKLAQAKDRAAWAERSMRAWYQTLSRSRVAAITALARGIVLRADADFDARPDLLNVRNGIVDLQTGDLLPHDPELLLTKLAPVDYQPEAEHRDWQAALEAVPEDVRDWYQTRLGQAITGHMTPDDMLVIQAGGGENGKTTLMAGISAALGEYFVQVSHRTLLADATAHSTELMTLRGRRLALLEETPEERRLSTARLKMLVGTPQITARYMRQDEVTFDVTHSLFLSTNYLPLIEESDHGTWRRLACLRFPYRWLKPGEQATGPLDLPGDPTLRDRIQQGEGGQHAAVLAWLVQGAVRWYEAGRVMPALPERVARDTRAWRADTDLIVAYLDDCLVFDSTAHVMARELLEDFNEWAQARGYRAWSDRMFASRFGGHGEVASHRVTRDRARPDVTLSRRSDAFGVPPARYRAWFGIRFRGDTDDAFAAEPAKDAAQADPASIQTSQSESVNQDNPGSGTGGTAGFVPRYIENGEVPREEEQSQLSHPSQRPESADIAGQAPSNVHDSSASARNGLPRHKRLPARFGTRPRDGDPVFRPGSQERDSA